MANKKISALNINTVPLTTDVLPIVNNGETKKMSLDGLTTYLNDHLRFPNVTGGTYADGIVVFTNSTGGTVSVSGFFTGSTDVFVTGGTYTAGTATFINSTGGTFDISGFSTGTSSSDTYITGGTYLDGTATFTNNSGGTFSVSGFSTGTTFFDTVVTGGTYADGTATFVNNSGGTFSVSGFSTGTTFFDTYVTGATYTAGTATFTNNTGGTFSVSGFVEGSSFSTVTTTDTLSINFSGDGTTANPLSASVNISQFDNGILQLTDGLFVPQTIQTGLGYGGLVTWYSGYTFEVSSAGYYIDGRFYSTPFYTVANGNPIVLNEADAVFNRLDVFYVDESATVNVLSGTPSSNPSKPSVDSNQIELSFALVEAPSSAATVTSQQIYLNNTGEPNEWSATTNAPARINVDSTLVKPIIGTKNVEATNSIAADSVVFTNAESEFITSIYSILTFNIQPKAISTSDLTRNRFRLWFGSNTSLIGNFVDINHGSFGFSLVSQTVQTISIPLSTFGLTDSSYVNDLTIMNNSKGQSAFGYYIGNIRLQGVPVTRPTRITDTYVTGGTYSNGTATFTNNSGATFTVTGFSTGGSGSTGPDTYTTGGTYSNGTLTLGNNTGGTINVSGWSIATSGTTVYSVNPATRGVNADNGVAIGFEAGFDVGAGAGQSFFFGLQAGYQAYNAYYATFIGTQAGYQATNALEMVAIGAFAGYQATNANTSQMIGKYAGNQATNAIHATFMGFEAGRYAANATYSTFIGSQAGLSATSAQQSNFLGDRAGSTAAGAFGSNFFGGQCGDGAVNAYSSNFMGNHAGYLALSANNSNFIGLNAGSGAAGAANSIFIGQNAGINSTNASYSTLLGFKVGAFFTANQIGSNNIIIGTNISLPSGTTNSMNLGGTLFGSGFYSTITGNPYTLASSTGRIGVGVQQPTARLHLISGSTALNSAPLKFSIGNLMSSVEDGAMEYDGNGLYFTVGGNRNLLMGSNYYLRPTAGSVSPDTAPIKLVAGPLNATPEDGAIEYDGNAMLYTIGSTRYTLGSKNGTFGFASDNGSSVVTVGVKDLILLPYGCVITGWRLLGDTTGSTTVDIWASSVGIPTVANSIITGGTKPNITLGNQYAISDNVSGWVTTFTNDTFIKFNIDSINNYHKLTLIVKIQYL